MYFPYCVFDYVSRGFPVLQFSYLGDFLRLTQTPFMKFLSTITSFFVFLILLIVVASADSKPTPSGTEFVLAAWIVGLIVAECREAYQVSSQIYFRSWWNLIDVVMLLMFLIIIVLRIAVWAQDSDATLFTANMMLAFSTTVACVRTLTVLQAHSKLGPLQVNVQR